MVRIGIGYDVHKLVKGRRLILGGEEIEFNMGLDGHSDADVVVHAVMDALLGAAALGDIGVQFPPSDKQYKDIDSCLLLEKVVALVEARGYEVGNIDTVIIAEKPKLSEHIPKMRENISRICCVQLEDISIKATTEEGLGLAGKGIGCHAVVTIYNHLT
jgi:2-C-methyl-D-erythritol 2,4-cyclodiphosphate synthase